MTLPEAHRLYGMIEVTWPAASISGLGPWLIRDGQGGGSRVSAATANGAVSRDDLGQAEDAMRDLGQTPLFMIRQGDGALDAMLDDAGYVVMDPVTLYAAPISDVTIARPDVMTIAAWPPLAIQAEVWAAGGIGASRLSVMERANCPKTTLLCRADDNCAGSVYIAIDGDSAMIHALEIGEGFRRRGLARALTIAAAHWAQKQGAAYLTLVTTDANVAANALYTSLGMAVVGQYHYRILPER